MIITVTPNPALDVIFDLGGELEPGGLNRAERSLIFPGGKGINVTRAIGGAGGESVSFALLGGHVGELHEMMLSREGISVVKLPCAAETRVNVCTISKTNRSTEVNAPGGPVRAAELAALTEAVTERAATGDVVILAGSVPICYEGRSAEYWKGLIPLLRKRGCTVVLDCAGEALRLAFEGEALPHLIKPNLDELRELVPSCFSGFSEEESAEGEILFKIVENASETIASRGVSVLCTLGALGAVYTSAEAPTEHIRQPAVPVSRVANIKGAGDTFLGVFAHRHFILNETIEASLAHAAKAASDHVGKI